MHALVVYESMFGDTAQIAHAIADGLGTGSVVRVVAVSDAPTPVPDVVDLVVVGGPTHAFGMSRTRTRSAAVQQGAAPHRAADRGVREWLAAAGSLHGTLAAAFDTHTRTRLPGSASGAIDHRLRHLGARMVAPAHSFYVTGMQGPLDSGELDRARRWGAELVALAAASRDEPAGARRPR